MSNKLIIFILIIGVIYRLFLTSNGNFLFNMDNGRDMVDVREMVVLKKPRLIGPTSAIEGLFNGPAWYYLLAAPFILTGGDPYGSIILEIFLWAIGGFFLLKLVSRWSNLLIIPIGILWVSSNYVVLTNLYAFNPNPVILLTPLLMYLLVEYLEKSRGVFIILVWFLAGLFFNFEMNFGVFMPIIILASLILTKKIYLLKQKWFWVGMVVFVLTLLPQIIFDLRHESIMSRAIFKHLGESGNSNIFTRFQIISQAFFDSFSPTMMNHKLFSWIILALFLTVKLDKVAKIAFIFIIVPFLGYLILPVTVNPWHLGAEMAASIILVGFLIKKLMEGNFLKKIISVFLFVSIIYFGLSNIVNFYLNDFKKPNLDPSLFKNEIAAIDFVYKYADGKNFKVYTYLPSVYDYPYQYLFWWYGLKTFGYLPIDYAYAPNKPKYISNKESFSETPDFLKKREDSNLVFLIKEPNHNYTRFGWEGAFVNLEKVEKQMVGSIEIEVKKEITQ